MFRLVAAGIAAALLGACGGGGESEPADPRNGTYHVYGSNGAQYTLTVDFNEARYSMSGSGINTSGAFSVDARTGAFTFGGAARFRTSEDLLVGSFDFGSGAKPFIAARSFVTSAADLSGDVNNLGVVYDAGGIADSRIYTSKWESGKLKACLQDAIQPVDVCPDASVWTFDLSVVGDEFVGVEAARNETIRFRVARSGNTRIFLRAEQGSSGRTFRVGLPSVGGLAGGQFFGGTSTGSWGSTSLTSTSYQFNGFSVSGASFVDSATLVAMASPAGMSVGPRTSDNAALFVIHSPALAAVVGARGGPAAGHMELSVP